MPNVSYFTVCGEPGVRQKGKNIYCCGSPHPKKSSFAPGMCVFVYVLIAKTTSRCLCAIRVCLCAIHVCVCVCVCVCGRLFTVNYMFWGACPTKIARVVFFVKNGLLNPCVCVFGSLFRSTLIGKTHIGRSRPHRNSRFWDTPQLPHT